MAPRFILSFASVCVGVSCGELPASRTFPLISQCRGRLAQLSFHMPPPLRAGSPRSLLTRQLSSMVGGLQRTGMNWDGAPCLAVSWTP